MCEIDLDVFFMKCRLSDNKRKLTMEKFYRILNQGSKKSMHIVYNCILLFFIGLCTLTPEKTAAQNLNLIGLPAVAPSAAFSVRKVVGNYNGPAVRVRRAYDNAEVDVAFDAALNISATSNVTFVAGVLINGNYINSFSLKTGFMNATSGSTTVTGTGTSFTTELQPGDMLLDHSSRMTIGIVGSISDNQNLTLISPAAVSTTGSFQFRARVGTEAFSTFYTIPSATSCFINTWYDQSGNNKHAFRAFKSGFAYQPRLVGGGVIQMVNNRPAILFQVSAQYLVCNSNTPVQTVSAVRNLFDVNANTTKFQTLFASPASSEPSIRLGYASNLNSDDWVDGTGTTPTNWVNGFKTMDGTLKLHTLNAAAATSSNQTFSISSGFQNDSINNPYGSGRGMADNISVSELILFPGVLTDADRKTLDCNQLIFFHITDTLLKIVDHIDSTCSAVPVSFTPGSPSVNYTWGTPVVSPVGSVTGATAQAIQSAAINQTLINNTANPATVTYTVTPHVCGTTGTPFQLTVTVKPSPAAPVITADYCSVNGFVKLTSSPASSYLWSTGQIASSINVNSAGSYAVTITSATGCTSTASFSVAQELVTNGNFNAGAVGFTTAYINDQNNVVPEGNYAVRTDANIVHPSFYGKDHTTGTGNFMIVNGKPAPAGATVWAQSNIPVTPNTTYYFSAWGLSLVDNNNAVLQFTINGFQNGSIAYLPKGYTNNNGPYTWVRFFGSWNSGSSTIANIAIANLNTALNGNDFGLDDISFGTLSPVSLSINPAANSGNAVCLGRDLVLTSNSIGGASPYTYAWTGPNSFSSNVANPTITTAAAGTHAGVYNLTVTDGFGCQVASSVTVSITGLPADKTPIAQLTTLCSGGATTINLAASELGVSYQLKDAGNLTVGAPVPGDGNSISFPTGLLNTSSTFTVLATNDNAGCFRQMSSAIVINIDPSPVLKITNQAVCSGTVNLTLPAVTNGSTGGGTISYWTDAAATVSLPNPASIAIAGTYYIKSETGSCFDIEPVVVTINANPSADFYYASPFCSSGNNPFPNYANAGVAGIFSASTGLNFVNSSTGQINLATSTPGTYTITNTVATSCTTIVATTNITITKLPSASFSYASNGLCQSINVASQSPVFGPGAAAGYFSSTYGLSFSIGTGAIDIGASTPGNYAIWNTINGVNGCPTVADTVFIDINPYAGIGGAVQVSASANQVCNGQTIDLYAVPNSYLSALLREKFNSLGLSWTKLNNSTGANVAAAQWTSRPDGFDDGAGAFNSNDNSSFFLASSTLQGAGTTAVVLTSAPMSTVGFTSLNLDFFHYFNRNLNGVATVEVSTNGTNWNSIATYNATQGSRNAFANPTINLNGYIGYAVFYIRFKFDATVDGCWAIDNVSLTGNSNNYTYSWASFPAGFSATTGDVTGVAPNASSFYILTATNSYGCSEPATPLPVTVLATQTLSGVSQPTVSCIGSAATIILTGLVPNSTSTVSYSIGTINQPPVSGVLADATGGASFTSTSLSALNNGQQLIITALDNGTCSKTFTNAVTINVQSSITWTGSISTNWFDAQNWCGGVPSGSSIVFIPNTPVNFPEINAGAGAVKNISIQSGASLLIAGGKLSVSGIITNNGSIDATLGTIELNGNVAQNISGGWFVNNALKSFRISNAAAITLSGAGGDSLRILDSLSFGVGGATLYTNDNLVLASTSTGTARVADITNNGTTPGNNFVGKVTVERFYPQSRSWRLVTSPLSNTGTILSNWQNNGNYEVGKGMFITGPNPGAATGLDASSYNNYSMKGWNSVTSNYKNVGNTKDSLLSGNLVTAGKAVNIGYYAFVRGDRRRGPQDNTVVGNMNNTTLSSKGNLQTGTQTFDINGGAGAFALIGNPYASSVDFTKTAMVNLDQSKFYVYDPSIGSVGAFVTLVADIANPGTFITTPPSSQTKNIQSSQAFFVEVTGPAASVTFNETSKVSYNNPLLFRPGRTSSVVQSIRIDLHQSNPDQSTLLVDGAFVQFSDEYNDQVDMDDALKFTNISENLSILRYKQYLTVERRPLIKDNDTLFLQLSKTTQRSYRFAIEPTNIDPSVTAFLEDSFTGKSTPINVLAANSFDFGITADVKSSAANRFRIVFRQAALGPLPVTFKTIKATEQTGKIAVNWTVENELNIKHYEVEKSADGLQFDKVNTTTATGANRISSGYDWLDFNPFSGNNFYRVKSIGIDGKFDYSEVVLVRMGTMASGIRIYPNPVTDGIIGAEFKNMAAGIYKARLLNAQGQTILQQTINHAPGTAMEYIQPEYKMPSGIYQLELTSPAKTITMVKVIVQ